jgi:exonuclease III
MSVIYLNDIKMVNWNANGIKSIKSSLIEFITRHKIDIVCVTELTLKITKILSLNVITSIEKTETPNTHLEKWPF